MAARALRPPVAYSRPTSSRAAFAGAGRAPAADVRAVPASLISEMLHDLAERGDAVHPVRGSVATLRPVAAAAVASDDQGPDAGSPRPVGVLAGGVADVQRLIGPAARELERGAEDPGVRLAGPGAGRGDNPVQEAIQAAAVQDGLERAVPVGDHNQVQAPVAQLRKRRHRVGIGIEADRVQELLCGDRDLELARDQRRAALAQVRQRPGVPALMRVLAVVVHLVPDGRDQGLLGHVRGHLGAQRDPGRLQLQQRAECSKKYSPGHLGGNTPLAMDKGVWDTYGNEIEAAIVMGVAIILALLVDRILLARAEHATDRMETQHFSREARTRLRLVRRLVFVTIILIGVIVALNQFAEIKRVATALLASTAVLGLIIGFAAQAVLANFVAGVLMAIRQPVRIGDLVSMDGDVHGRVNDIALTYTSVDRGDGSMIVVPNAKVITEIVVNHSAGHPSAPVAAEVWLPADTDIEAAPRALEGSEVTGLRLQELTADGALVQVRASLGSGRDRDARAAAVRELAHDAFREAGLLRQA